MDKTIVKLNKGTIDIKKIQEASKSIKNNIDKLRKISNNNNNYSDQFDCISQIIDYLDYVKSDIDEELTNVRCA